MHVDASARVAGEAVFEAIGNQLVDDRSTGNGFLQIQHRGRPGDAASHAGLPVRSGQMIGHAAQIQHQIERAEIGLLVEKLVNHGHGQDAVLALVEGFARMLVFHQIALHAEQAGNYLAGCS